MSYFKVKIKSNFLVKLVCLFIHPRYFQDLQPQVKLKLLLSFFHISRRNLELWRVQLETILEVALRDSEPWVSMLAELMKTFPGTGEIVDKGRNLKRHKEFTASSYTIKESPILTREGGIGPSASIPIKITEYL